MFNIVDGVSKLNTQDEFLGFIATEAIPDQSCYHGWDLDVIRTCQKNFENCNKKSRNCTPCRYTKERICKYTGLKSFNDVIQTNVDQKKALCDIKATLSHKTNNPFTSTYLIVRYIADYILPHGSCYFGYDLDRIRSGSLNATTINDAKVIDGFTAAHISGTDALIKESTRAQDVLNIRSTICKLQKICDDEWVDFLRCILRPSSQAGVLAWGIPTCSMGTNSALCKEQLNSSEFC